MQGSPFKTVIHQHAGDCTNAVCLPSARKLVAPQLHLPSVMLQSSLQMKTTNNSILEHRVRWSWHFLPGLVNHLSLTFLDNYNNLHTWRYSHIKKIKWSICTFYKWQETCSITSLKAQALFNRPILIRNIWLWSLQGAQHWTESHHFLIHECHKPVPLKPWKGSGSFIALVQRYPEYL